ncbi:MAG: histidinol dehydrogenase [Actinomycetota bacterium]
MLARSDLRGVADLRSALAPPPVDPGPVEAVRAVLADVRARGDAAVRDLTERFDGCRVDDLRVPASALAAALADLSGEVRRALDRAHGEILAYHSAQTDGGFTLERGGIRLTERVVPVRRAGCYSPGGRAAYPSTVLMTAVPARVAGVAEIALCVPPGPDGSVPAVTLAAAAVAGVDEVYRIGGAQAIAALAYGTESIPAVDVIVGPGNAYVALAKREVASAGLVGIDGFAGPSEVAIVADSDADPTWVAVDLLAQAEHGPGGAAVLVTWEPAVADAVDAALGALLCDAPRRTDIEATLASGGRAVIVDDAEAALTVVDVLAPEHLELVCAGAGAFADRVRNAGAIFVGPYAPAALGDYIAGVNHVLPTARSARFAGALRVDTFCKRIHVVATDAAGLAAVAPAVVTLATEEGLAEHARSVTVRLEAAPGASRVQAS